MPDFPPYVSFAYSPVTFVPVIASFDTDGHIRPLYVRINGISMKVDSYYERTMFSNTIEFNCKVIDNDYLKPVLLTYYQAERVWSIPK
uniref:hypothetical protein n=1 Tax=Acetatifactor sp. TaxID=1872090 RepID=UPI004056E906